MSESGILIMPVEVLLFPDILDMPKDPSFLQQC